MSHWKYTDTEYKEDIGWIGILERDDKCVLLDVGIYDANKYLFENMKRGDTYAEHNRYGINKEGIISYESVMISREMDRLFREGKSTDYLNQIIYGG